MPMASLVKEQKAKTEECDTTLATLQTDLTDVKAVINQLKEQGIVYWRKWLLLGRKVVITLACEDPTLIDVAVLFQPFLITHDDVKTFKVPVQFNIPETDQQVPLEKAEEFKSILASRPEVCSNSNQWQSHCRRSV